MSIPIKTQLQCPKCKEVFSTTIWGSVNTDYAPDLPQKLITGEFFSCACPKCQAKINLVYPMLYNDMKHGFFIQLSPDEKSYSEALEYFKTQKHSLLRYRLVRDTQSLGEKVSIIENGRDDKLIELCKWFYWAQLTESYPEFNCQHEYYYVDKNGIEYVDFISDNGKHMHCQLLEQTYSLFSEKYSNLLEQEEKLKCEFDRNWANSFLLDSRRAEKATEDKSLTYKDENDARLQSDNAQFDTATNAKTISTKKTCQKCGANLPPNAKFCAMCGRKVEIPKPQPRFCRFCGSKIVAGSLFCHNCGKRLQED